MKEYSRYLYKKSGEIGKKVWEITRKDGTLLDSCRTKSLAMKVKSKFEKEYLEELELIRI